VNTATQNLEDYNPFDDSPQNNRPTTTARGAANPPQYGGTGTTDQSKSPAVMSPTQDLPPSYARTTPVAPQQGATPQISTAELQRRQEELERKARELERREAELQNAPFNARKNNWPPLPEKFPVQACFYQDINVDIPVEFQRIVRYLYYLWVLNAGVLTANFIAWTIRLVTRAEFGGFFTALVFVLVFIPASYVCWFRPAYKAFKTDSSFNFMVFFFVFFFQFITSLAFCTVVPGACGIVDGINVIVESGVKNIIVGILVLAVGLGFAASAILNILMLIRVHRIYRSTGASFAKAQQEFASGVMRNEHVQGAATNIASEAIRAQMSAATNSGPRY
jgi:hypothetical protein